MFGSVFFLLLAPITGLAIYAMKIDDMELWYFIVFKGLFASVLAGIVTPIITLAALGDDM